MTGNRILDVAIAIQGLISAIGTLIALFAPKGSKVGVWAAKVGTDYKGQTTASLPPPKDDTPQKLPPDDGV